MEQRRDTDLNQGVGGGGGNIEEGRVVYVKSGYFGGEWGTVDLAVQVMNCWQSIKQRTPQ